MSNAAISPSEAERRTGFAMAASAYVMWGLLPLYLKLVAFADVREVLGQRVLWALPSALVAVFVLSGWRRGLREIAGALRLRTLATLGASACFIFTNWGFYVWLVLNQRVTEAALAYFIAPVLSVAVGVLFFRERITAAQIGALAFVAAGVVVQGFALGAPPWMSLGVCATWMVYAVIRKQVQISAAAGLFIECLAITPLAVALLFWVSQTAALSFPTSAGHAALLALAGPATALPLMTFAFGARRVSFATLGLLQFIAPTLQFAIGMASGEAFTFLRGVSFALIWLGLGLYSWDSLRRARES